MRPNAKEIGQISTSTTLPAINVAKSFNDFLVTGEMVKIDCADNVVRKINSMRPNTIKSLDIISHGTPYSLNFSVADDQNCGFVTNVAAMVGINVLGLLSDQINEFSGRSRYLSDIDYGRFTEDARVQIHGCSIAAEDGFSFASDNIAELVSKLLHKAGKIRAVVIGHLGKANPNIGGTKKVEEQDYRHGTRAVYHNGEVLFKTTQERFIPDSLIDAKLAVKKR